MLPVLQIGPLAIQLPGLLLLLGLWLGLNLAEKHSARHGIPANRIYTLTIAVLISAVCASRLVYVLRNIEAFTQNPIRLISPSSDLMDPWGLMTGAAGMILIFLRRYKLSFWALFDALTPLLAVFMVVINLANLASGNWYGTQTSLPWAINLFGAWRHPTQIYGLFAAGIVLALFWPGSNRTRNMIPGLYALGFTALTAAYRLFLEAFRADSMIIAGGFRSIQLIAWLVLASSLWLITKRLRINHG